MWSTVCDLISLRAVEETKDDKTDAEEAEHK